MPSTAIVEQRVVTGYRLGAGVGPVRQQREAQIVVRAGQVVHLEAARSAPRSRRASSAASARRPVCAAPPARRRAAPWRGSATGPNRAATWRFTSATAASVIGITASAASQTSVAGGTPRRANAEERQSEDQGGGEGDGRQVAENSRGGVCTPRPVAQRRAKPEGLFERRAPAADEIVAGILGATVGGAVPADRAPARRPRPLAERPRARRGSIRAPTLRSRAGSGRASGNPSPRTRGRRRAPRPRG